LLSLLTLPVIGLYSDH